MGRDNLNFAAIIALSENKVKYYEDGRVGGNISETVNNSGRPHHQNAFSKTKKNRRLSEICQTEEVRFIVFYVTSDIRIFRSLAVHLMPIIFIKVTSNLKY